MQQHQTRPLSPNEFMRPSTQLDPGCTAAAEATAAMLTTFKATRPFTRAPSSKRACPEQPRQQQGDGHITWQENVARVARKTAVMYVLLQSLSQQTTLWPPHTATTGTFDEMHHCSQVRVAQLKQQCTLAQGPGVSACHSCVRMCIHSHNHTLVPLILNKPWHARHPRVLRIAHCCAQLPVKSTAPGHSRTSATALPHNNHITATKLFFIFL
jgi:hypothetical protein